MNQAAAPPSVISKPIRLKRMIPQRQYGQQQKMKPANHVLQGQITDCFLKSLNGNDLVLSIAYKMSPEIEAPVYTGGWLYESRQQAANAGYIPTQVTELPAGTIDLPLRLYDTSFTSKYLEVFLIQDGIVFGKTQFNFPFVWTGTTGQLQGSGQHLPGDQQTIPSQPAMQGEPRRSFCSRYADAAIAQFNMGIKYQLAGIIPPVWTDDRSAHFNWCMQTAQHIVRSGDMMRAQHLLRSLPANVISNMRIRGQQIPGLDPGRGP